MQNEFSSGRRRSRRAKDVEHRTRISKILHAPWLDRAVRIGVIVAGSAYLVIMTSLFRSDYNMLGFRALYVPKSEMLYGFGRPALVRNGDAKWTPVTPAISIESFDEWRYPNEGGGTYLIHFDQAGLSDLISCYHLEGERGACPASFGVHLGDLEDRVAYDLGDPPLRILSGPSAVMRYPSIGAEFELREFKVRRISIRADKSPVIGRIPRFIRFLVP